MCEDKKFQLQSMSNVIICIDKRFAVKNSDVSCLALIFNLSIPIMTILQTKNWFKVARHDESYTFFFSRSVQTLGTYDLVVKVSRSDSGDMVSIPAGC